MVQNHCGPGAVVIKQGGVKSKGIFHRIKGEQCDAIERKLLSLLLKTSHYYKKVVKKIIITTTTIVVMGATWSWVRKGSISETYIPPPPPVSPAAICQSPLPPAAAVALQLCSPAAPQTVNLQHNQLLARLLPSSSSSSSS